MDMLIQWVTQIVIFILLATIIDLLIPAHSMKMYVKFVVGLILILIVMQAIFYLLQTDMKQALEDYVNDYLLDDQATEDMNDLNEMQKREIQSTQHEYILKQMGVQLESTVELPLMDSYQAGIV